MNKLQFINLLWMIYGNKKINIDKIQSYGLLAIKIGQTHALRVDFLPADKCAKLSQLYRATTPIPSEEALKQVNRSWFSCCTFHPKSFNTESVRSI